MLKLKDYFKSNEGFTIIEAVVALAIMSIGFLAYMTYTKMLANAEKEVADSISATRVLNTVVNDLKADNRYIIPLDVPPKPEYFENRDISAERCYDRMGGRIFFPSEGFTTAEDKNTFIEEKCFYYTEFYKTKVTHQNSNLKARIPLSQIHIRVRYFQGTKDNRRAIYTTMSPFVVNTAYF